MLSDFNSKLTEVYVHYIIKNQVSFNNFRREFFFWIGFGLVLFGVGQYLDFYIFGWNEQYLQTAVMDQIALFLTEKLIHIVLIILALFAAYRLYKSPHHQSQLVPAFFGLIITGIFSYIFKGLFKIPRPFDQSYQGILGDITPLLDISSHSFPSAHTAISFSLLIPLWRISKPIGILWGIFALIISFARVYEKVHFPSDIAGGIFLGGIIGAFFSHPEIHKLLKTLWKLLEFRRQSFHICTGVMSVFLHWTGILRLRFLAILLVVGLIVSLISQRYRIPIISDILEMFDRARDKDFPGRGAFYFLLGVLLTILVFHGDENIKIAYAAILILSFGDSLNHFVSKPFHDLCTQLPWNRKKNILGVGLGMFSGALAAQFFVPFYAAFLGSLVAIFFETFPIRIGKFYIDDNIFVPLIAGGVIWSAIYFLG